MPRCRLPHCARDFKRWRRAPYHEDVLSRGSGASSSADLLLPGHARKKCRTRYALAAAKRLAIFESCGSRRGVDQGRALAALSAFFESAHRRWQAVGEDWGEVISNIFGLLNALRGIPAKRRATWPMAAPVGSTPGTRRTGRRSAGGCRGVAGGRFACLITPTGPPRGTTQRVVSLSQQCRHCGSASHLAVSASSCSTRTCTTVRAYRRFSTSATMCSTSPSMAIPPTSTRGLRFRQERGGGLGYNLNLPMPHGSKSSVLR